MAERRYELKLLDGRRVEWSGKSGEDAARRYVDHVKNVDPDVAVIAYRLTEEERFGVFSVHPRQIIG